jgi:hypothetical protein
VHQPTADNFLARHPDQWRASVMQGQWKANWIYGAIDILPWDHRLSDSCIAQNVFVIIFLLKDHFGTIATRCVQENDASRGA